jgi:hypothetical protein
MSFNANTLYRAVDIEKLAKECSDAIKGRSNQRPFFNTHNHSQSSQGRTQPTC